MEREKVCPLRTAAGVVVQGAAQGRGVLPEGWGRCMGPACAWYDAGRECAWYDAARGCCAVLTLARAK